MALLSLVVVEVQQAKKSRDPEATLRKGEWLHSIMFGAITLRVSNLSPSSQNGKDSQLGMLKIIMLKITTLSHMMQLAQAVFSQTRLMM